MNVSQIRCSARGRGARLSLSTALSWAAVLASAILVPRVQADEPPVRSGPATARVEAAQPQEVSAGAVLEKAWPGHPEWLAMLAEIFVKGDQMSGNDGWFRKSGPKIRFDWPTTRAALDRDGDGSVRRPEFPGPDGDFARLDRNRDGVLGAADFDFSGRSSGPPTGSVLFSRLDHDGNGRVTRAELDRFFQATDRDGLGFVSLSDLQQALDPPPALLRGTPGGPDGPTRWMFLKAFFNGELGGLTPGPELNADAPDFTLSTADGQQQVTLSKLVGPKPVVLVFGNFTCRPFRGQGGNLEKLYQRYKDRATFLTIYVREAHPTDGWRMEINDVLGVAIRQPRTDSERAGVAQLCNKTLGLSFPMLVDTIDDPVNRQYCGVPSRLYLVDRQGKIAYKSGRGPFGFKPGEMEQSLVLLLQQEATTTSPDGRRPPTPVSLESASQRHSD
jgi:hypothetical protein